MAETPKSDRFDAERRVLLDVAKEQDFQVEKWGVQRHGDFKWLAILIEEVGEVSKEALDYEEHRTDTHHDMPAFGMPDCCKAFEQRIYSETVQVAAVALSWLRDKDLSGKRYTVRKSDALPSVGFAGECGSPHPIEGAGHVRYCEMPAGHNEHKTLGDHRDSFGWWKA